jgi:SAM-dependent methyltransferase
MHEILRHLGPNDIVLDLGCQDGSFPEESTQARVIRADRESPSKAPILGKFIGADAGALPFGENTFTAVIANHSLEHFENLASALDEIGRVVNPNGALFVAVPDASTFADKVYRWLARGGGHVNPFRSAAETAGLIEARVGLPLAGTRLLCSSLSFMNRRNAHGPAPRRSILLGGGYEWTLFLYAWLSRRLDRLLGTRTRIYGWAFFFGAVREPIDSRSWVNVCVRCGSGTQADGLKRANSVRMFLPFLPVYICPVCGARNPFFEDFG